MKSRLRAVLAVLIAMVTVACQQNGRGSAGLISEVRDSAGIRIIENAEPPHGSRLPWRIGPRPTISVLVRGHLNDGTYYARDATKLPDGRIVVAHREGHLLVFDASGLQASWNGDYDSFTGERTGEPGQLVLPDGVAPWPGDSIIAWGTIWRGEYGISVFDTQGKYGRHFKLSRTDETDPRVVDGTDDGSILAFSASDPEDSIAVQLWDSEGELRSSLDTLPGLEWYHDAEGYFMKWFAPTPVLAPWGELVAVGNTGRYELKAFRVDGAMARIVRRDHKVRSTTPEDVEAQIERVLAESSRNSTEEPLWRQQLQSIPGADHLPVFGRVLSDASGHLWVQEYQAPREEPAPPLWTVFDPEGRALGFVATPLGLTVLEIGEDYVLGTTREESPLEFVQLWPLKRSGE